MRSIPAYPIGMYISHGSNRNLDFRIAECSEMSAGFDDGTTAVDYLYLRPNNILQLQVGTEVHRVKGLVLVSCLVLEYCLL